MAFSDKLKRALTFAFGPEGAASEAELETAVLTQPPGNIPLADGHVLVGGAGGVATDVALSGDASIADTGALTVLAVGGKKIARGVHQQAAASDTIPTGLATVVAVVAVWRDTPTLKQMFLTATIGDQAGAPAAGSFLSKTFKPTANNDVTPAAATDFTDNLSFNWIAIGT